jgi:hypothetical protein
MVSDTVEHGGDLRLKLGSGRRLRITFCGLGRQNDPFRKT